MEQRKVGGHLKGISAWAVVRIYLLEWYKLTFSKNFCHESNSRMAVYNRLRVSLQSTKVHRLELGEFPSLRGWE